jgi:hypothetical protein
MSRATGPFKVLKKINDNAYKLEFSVDFRVSPHLTFHICARIWARKMRCHRGRFQFKREMMRT